MKEQEAEILKREEMLIEDLVFEILIEKRS